MRGKEEIKSKSERNIRALRRTGDVRRVGTRGAF